MTQTHLCLTSTLTSIAANVTDGEPMLKLRYLIIAALAFARFASGQSQSDSGLDAANAFLDCANGDGESCLEAGIAYSEAGPRQDFKRAKTAFEEGCKLQEVYSCANLGDIYYYGKSVEKNRNRAAHFYAIACDGDVYERCSMLASMYSYGYGVNEDKNEMRLQSLNLRAA